jgi:DNA-binding transcriptional LysR family regulator
VELRHLRYFVAVAEMENVSRAALKLHVSQPALSRQIRDLEDEIGFSLLERTAKSVRLTDAGRAFLDNARALLQNADEAVTKARAVASAEPTELHVGYSPTPTAKILPKILRAFQRKMPNVHQGQRQPADREDCDRRLPSCERWSSARSYHRP